MFLRTEKSIRDFILFYPIVSIIILINILVWLLMYIIPLDWKYGLSFGEILYIFGVGNNILISEGEYWRLFTPIFMHAQGLTHVLFNSFSLILFGPALEQMVGKWRFILAYVGTGILANIGTYVIDPASPVSHLGASGAIYGLFGIYLFMVYFRKHLIDPQSASIVQVIFAIGLIMSFLQPRVNIPAHIFGAISGFIIATLVLKNAQPFSHVKNYIKKAQRQTVEEGSVHEAQVRFDPDRHRKQRLSPDTKRKLKWIGFFILLIAILTMSYYRQL